MCRRRLRAGALNAAAIPHLLLKDRLYGELYRGIEGPDCMGSVFGPEISTRKMFDGSSTAKSTDKDRQCIELKPNSNSPIRCFWRQDQGPTTLGPVLDRTSALALPSMALGDSIRLCFPTCCQWKNPNQLSPYFWLRKSTKAS